jgi:hypothetical protein
MPVIIPTQEAEIRRITVQSQPGQIVHETLSQKYSTQKMAGRVPQVVEHLRSKCENLSSNPSTTTTKKKKKFMYKSLVPRGYYELSGVGLVDSP